MCYFLNLEFKVHISMKKISGNETVTKDPTLQKVIINQKKICLVKFLIVTQSVVNPL